jgi:flagellar biosynthesis protein FlhF
MRIKRFQAPDMRTALRMIRDEQGPDAVILSNRATAGGIEVVAATDYDEALVAQALRAAAPGLETTFTPQVTHARATAGITATIADEPVATAAPTANTGTAANMIREAAATSAIRPATSAPARESLMSRARAVFKIGDGPTLAELSAASTTNPHSQPASTTFAQAPAMATTYAPANTGASSANTTPEPTRFEAMMAALTPAQTATLPNDQKTSHSGLAIPSAERNLAPLESDNTSKQIPHCVRDEIRGEAPEHQPVEVPTGDPGIGESEIPKSTTSDTVPRLRAVASGNDQPSDPTISAMRDELARMRQLMETQMEQLSLERLRGSPARAAVFDALLGFGCEDTLAQAVAARIDPRLPPAEIREPMFVELARMLTIARSEPIDDGGVIALVGPTGAGKTTTAAKLAARFAARHRARDVALVTTDAARPGAREQLHAHGRRLGITVCEAAGPEGLQEALAQLVDYPLVLVDTTGHAPRDRALFSQILWLRASRKVRSLLVLPANAHPHDLGEVIRRYRPAAPEAVVLTKLDEAGRLGSALSVAVRHGLSLAYTTQGQEVPSDIEAADAGRLVHTLEKLRRAADNPLAIEDRHAVV